MEDINHIVAENLKRLREERNLSLGEAARLTGVSKSLLSQIERGVVNPTLATVWKIAGGLKISFSRLATRQAADFELVRVADTEPISADQGRYRNYPLFGFDESRRFEIYYIELDPGARLAAEPHLPGSEEFLTVFDGRLVLTAGEREAELAPGSALRFPADRPHAYFNPGREVCRLSMIIHYP